MSALHFEWDDEKAAANAKKHGIGFEEAKLFFETNAPNLSTTRTTQKAYPSTQLKLNNPHP